MTENHHPDSRVEATRLRRMMGSALITDSFGESRYVAIRLCCTITHTHSQMDGGTSEHKSVSQRGTSRRGSLTCTSLGDLRFKPFGVTPEPEVRAKLLEGT